MRYSIKILAFFLNSVEYGKHVGGSERRFLEVSTCLRKLGAETFALEYKPSLAVKWGYSGYHSIEISRRLINHAVLDPIRIILHGIEACMKNKCNIVYMPNRGVWGYNSSARISI